MAGGRPKADTTTRRDCVVSVRLTAAERAAIEARAALSGEPLADYLRAAALPDAAPRRRRPALPAGPSLTPDELAALNAIGVDLRAIGSNANQIARALNAGADDPGLDGLADLGRLADRLRPQLEAIFARYLA